jgi:hypothetical protein
MDVVVMITEFKNQLKAMSLIKIIEGKSEEIVQNS